ncbi:MAG: alpha/beta hydrolase [Blastocatellia bacterium]
MPEVTERRIVQEFPCWYDLYVPDGAGPKPLLIALHGYGGDKTSMMKLARRINDQDYVIAALQGPHHHMIIPGDNNPEAQRRGPGIGFGWLTNFKAEDSVALHHRLISQIIDEVAETGMADQSRVFLMGFSQACGVNFRYAFTHAPRVHGVIAICGGIPGDWATEGKYAGDQLDVLYIAAERDQYYKPEQIQKNAAALETRARSVRLAFFNTRHEVPRDSYGVIDDWLRERSGNHL